MIVSLLDLKSVEYVAYCYSYELKLVLAYYLNVNCITSLMKCRYYVTYYIKQESYKNHKKQTNGSFSMTKYIDKLNISNCSEKLKY